MEINELRNRRDWHRDTEVTVSQIVETDGFGCGNARQSARFVIMKSEKDASVQVAEFEKKGSCDRPAESASHPVRTRST